MRFRLSVAVTLAVALLDTNVFWARAQVSPTQSTTLFVKMDRHEYSLRDTIVMDVGLRNDGRQPIYVYNRMAWGRGGGLTLLLRDRQGNPVEPEVLDDTVLPPPAEDDRDLLSRLAPGMFVGTRRRLPVRRLVAARGTYVIEVVYRAALSRDLVPRDLQDRPALWMDSPGIRSEPIELRITD